LKQGGAIQPHYQKILDRFTAAECMDTGRPFVTRFPLYASPLLADIARLDSALPRALGDIAARNEWRRDAALSVAVRLPYEIRYYVATTDGKISVFGYCADDSVDELTDVCPPPVQDGGDCIWQIRYDIAGGTFDHFSTNGFA
jgi:hypothetical protein